MLNISECCTCTPQLMNMFGSRRLFISHFVHKSNIIPGYLKPVIKIKSKGVQYSCSIVYHSICLTTYSRLVLRHREWLRHYVA